MITVMRPVHVDYSDDSQSLKYQHQSAKMKASPIVWSTDTKGGKPVLLKTFSCHTFKCTSVFVE